MLSELDKELTRRGLPFVRYADDSMIFCKSKRAAKRVKESVTRFIEGKLHLKVNRDKTVVSYVQGISVICNFAAQRKVKFMHQFFVKLLHHRTYSVIKAYSLLPATIMSKNPLKKYSGAFAIILQVFNESKVGRCDSGTLLAAKFAEVLSEICEWADCAFNGIIQML